MKLLDFFKYKPVQKYHFSLQQTQDMNVKDTANSKKQIYTAISSNLDFIKTEYNFLINSDIKIREFSLLAHNKTYKAFLIYIDGMVDNDLINNYILNPLMLRNRINSFVSPLKSDVNNQKENNKITIKKVKKFNLVDYIYNNLIPQNSVEKETSFDNIISGINSGNCVLFVDTINTAFNLEVKGFKQRSVESPKNEIIIKGPHESFVENLRTNTSMLRRIVNNQNLIIENISVGEITQTSCSLCYMKNITNSDLVAEAKFRLNNLSIDSLISAGQLEQLIEDDDALGVPQMISSERPDKCVKALMQGRIVILVNGNPYALIAPAILIDFLSSPEDSNLKPLFANFLKFIRSLAFFIALLLPGIYIAVTGYHQEILPTELLFSILASRENVPFPILFELLVMEISFELIREGSLRIPSPIGPSLGIVGTLILGEAAVSANIVSPILIIVVAITGLSSFAIPDFYFSFHLRVYRFAFTILGYIAGLLGIGLGLFVYTAMLSGLKSFGVPYTSPFAPGLQDLGLKFFIPPFWKQEHRESFLSPKKERSQSNISMKWKV